MSLALDERVICWKTQRHQARGDLVAPIVVIALALAACGTDASSPSSATTQDIRLTVVDSAPPPNGDVVGAHWIKIRGAGGVATNEQLAAVFRPAGQGPFPLLIELAGGLGLTDAEVAWAARLAQAGFVTVAGCWQPSAWPPATVQFHEITLRRIECRNLQTTEADRIAALIEAGRMQPGVSAHSVVLYGTSSGGAAALDTIASRNDIRAAVVDSGDAPGPDPSKINSPVLFLVGTDDEYDPFTNQKDYIDALLRAGKPVEWHYYQGGRHAVFLDPVNKDDAIKRSIDFLNRNLLGS